MIKGRIQISAFRQYFYYWINFDYMNRSEYISFGHSKRDLLNKFADIREYFNRTYGKSWKATKWLSKHKGDLK